MRIYETLLLIVYFLFVPILLLAESDSGYSDSLKYNIAQIDQTGFHNTANIEQINLNRANVKQIGLNNLVKINQTICSLLNNTNVIQIGLSNVSFQSQIGHYNDVLATQVGSYNNNIQNQSGSMNKAIAFQYGMGNTSFQNQFTFNNEANVLQIGYYNKSIQLQGITGTTNNKNTMIQIGIGIISIMVQ